MRDQLVRRLAELRSERQAGEKMLAKVEAERADLQQTLLRISGAIQVLEELMGAGADAEPPGRPAVEPDGDGMLEALT